MTMYNKMFPQLTPEEDKNLWKLANRENKWSLLWENMTGQAKGLVWTLYPFLEEAYKDDQEELVAAYEREFRYMNTNPNLGGFIVGLVYAMEMRRAQDKNSVSAESISDVRIALCGPLAGVGDAIMQNVLKVIFAGLVMDMSANGNALAPILFVLLYGLTQRFIMDYTTYLGYASGTTAIDKLFSGGVMEAVTKAISLLGVIMTGAMTASVVTFKLKWVLKIGAASLDVQATLDSIFPGFVAIALTFGIVALLKKKVKIVAIVYSILAICVLLGFLGIV